MENLQRKIEAIELIKKSNEFIVLGTNKKDGGADVLLSASRLEIKNMIFALLSGLLDRGFEKEVLEVLESINKEVEKDLETLVKKFMGVK